MKNKLLKFLTILLFVLNVSANNNIIVTDVSEADTCSIETHSNDISFSYEDDEDYSNNRP